jgi:hypothetical protein
MIRRQTQSLDTFVLKEYEIFNRQGEHRGVPMDVDAEKLEQAVLALLHLNTFDEKSGKRAWKALPWSVMDQLHQKGYISDPATKNKSVWLSDEGARLSEELFEKFFAAR